MSNLFEAYQVSANGRWYKLKYFASSFKLANATSDNPKFKSMLVDISKKQDFSLDDRESIISKGDEAVDLLATAYSKTIILDWKNVCDHNGNVIEFNQVNVKDLLIKLPKVFEELINFASNYRNFTKDKYSSSDEEVYYTGKKSQTTSNQKTSTQKIQ